MIKFKKELEKLLKKNNLVHIKDKLFDIAEESILVHISSDKEDYTKVGSSRFCGYPDLPSKIKWPKVRKVSEWYYKDYIGLPKLFVAQINLEELPQIGMLYFFIGPDCDTHTRKKLRDAKIFYYPHKVKKAQDVKENITKTFCTFGDPEDKHHLLNSYKIIFEKVLTIPLPDSEEFNSLNLEEDSDKYDNLYWKYYSFIKKGYDRISNPNMMLGFVPPTNGENSKKEISELKNIGKENDLEIILSLQSDSDLGLNFGDAYALNFFIRKDDLEKLNFKNVETGI